MRCRVSNIEVENYHAAIHYVVIGNRLVTQQKDLIGCTMMSVMMIAMVSFIYEKCTVEKNQIKLACSNQLCGL